MFVTLQESLTPVKSEARKRAGDILSYVYSIAYDDLQQHWITFLLSWVVVTLQFMHFHALIDNVWDISVANVVLKVTGFVTEIPLSPYTAYIIPCVVW
jgi:hypothetical protein